MKYLLNRRGGEAGSLQRSKDKRDFCQSEATWILLLTFTHILSEFFSLRIPGASAMPYLLVATVEVLLHLTRAPL